MINIFTLKICVLLPFRYLFKNSLGNLYLQIHCIFSYDIYQEMSETEKRDKIR